jgi:hypothetical protein
MPGEPPVIEFLHPDGDQYDRPELCKVRDSDHIEPVHEKQRSGENEQERQNQLTGLCQSHHFVCLDPDVRGRSQSRQQLFGERRI